MGGGGARRGTRTSACTDIAPLACTAENSRDLGAPWRSGTAWKAGSRDGLTTRRRPRDAWRSRDTLALILAGPRLPQATRLPPRAEDKAVVYGNVQETPGVDELPRDGAVVSAWRGPPPVGGLGGQYDARRVEGDGEPEHFRRVHQGRSENPPHDLSYGDHARLGVHRNHVETLCQLPGNALAQRV
jgi:hypothetical protein